MISAEIETTAHFHDLDPMRVVWHGNYPRFLELARHALLERIGYNYPEMENSGVMWPIVDLRIKYVRPIRFSQRVRVTATLGEYLNRLRIDYRILCAESGQTLTKASTIQLAVLAASGETCLETPAVLRDKVAAVLP